MNPITYEETILQSVLQQDITMHAHNALRGFRMGSDSIPDTVADAGTTIVRREAGDGYIKLSGIHTRSVEGNNITSVLSNPYDYLKAAVVSNIDTMWMPRNVTIITNISKAMIETEISKVLTDILSEKIPSEYISEIVNSVDVTTVSGDMSKFEIRFAGPKPKPSKNSSQRIYANNIFDCEHVTGDMRYEIFSTIAEIFKGDHIDIVKKIDTGVVIGFIPWVVGVNRDFPSEPPSPQETPKDITLYSMFLPGGRDKAVYVPFSMKQGRNIGFVSYNEVEREGRVTVQSVGTNFRRFRRFDVRAVKQRGGTYKFNAEIYFAKIEYGVGLKGDKESLKVDVKLGTLLLALGYTKSSAMSRFIHIPDGLRDVAVDVAVDSIFEYDKGVVDEESAVDYIEIKIQKELKNDPTDEGDVPPDEEEDSDSDDDIGEKQEQLLKRFLVHLTTPEGESSGDKWILEKAKEERARFICMTVMKVILVSCNKLKPDNGSDLSNQYVQTSMEAMTELAYQSTKSLINQLKKLFKTGEGLRKPANSTKPLQSMVTLPSEEFNKTGRVFLDMLYIGKGSSSTKVGMARSGDLSPMGSMALVTQIDMTSAILKLSTHKKLQQRALDPSYQGYLCLVHVNASADRESGGRHLHFAYTAEVSPPSTEGQVNEIIAEAKAAVERASVVVEERTTDFSVQRGRECLVLVVNHRMVFCAYGKTSNITQAIENLYSARKTGVMNITRTSIYKKDADMQLMWNPTNRTDLRIVHLDTSPGRYLRPLIDLSVLMAVDDPEEYTESLSRVNTLEGMLKHNAVTMVSPRELMEIADTVFPALTSQNIDIQMDWKNQLRSYKFIEFSPQASMGTIASYLPFLDNTKGIKAVLYAKQMERALPQRDPVTSLVNTPREFYSKAVYETTLEFGNSFAGTSAFMAVIPYGGREIYHGGNEEDAVVVNRQSAELGMLRLVHNYTKSVSLPWVSVSPGGYAEFTHPEVASYAPVADNTCHNIGRSSSSTGLKRPDWLHDGLPTLPFDVTEGDESSYVIGIVKKLPSGKIKDTSLTTLELMKLCGIKRSSIQNMAILRIMLTYEGNMDEAMKKVGTVEKWSASGEELPPPSILQEVREPNYGQGYAEYSGTEYSFYPATPPEDWINNVVSVTFMYRMRKLTDRCDCALEEDHGCLSMSGKKCPCAKRGLPCTLSCNCHKIKGDHVCHNINIGRESLLSQTIILRKGESINLPSKPEFARSLVQRHVSFQKSDLDKMHALLPNGLPKAGARVEAGDYLVGMMVHYPTMDGRLAQFIDNSEIFNPPGGGTTIWTVVESSVVNGIVTVDLISDSQPLRDGDKIALRQGQKGAVSLVHSTDLPYFPKLGGGFVPDLFIHTAAVTGRTTPIIVMEQLLGNICVTQGKRAIVSQSSTQHKLVDVKGCFNRGEKIVENVEMFDVTTLFSQFKQFTPMEVRCGITGKILSKKGYAGPVGISRLRQSGQTTAKDVAKVVDEGSIDPYTMQPKRGGDEGALRLGTDEGNLMTLLGSMFFMKDLKSVDERPITMCTSCKEILGNDVKTENCILCNGDTLATFSISHPMLTLINSLAAIGISFTQNRNFMTHIIKAAAKDANVVTEIWDSQKTLTPEERYRNMKAYLQYQECDEV